MADGDMPQLEPDKKQQNPEPDNKSQQQLTFLDELEAFGDRTTFHGLSYVLKRNASVVRRITWSVIFVASAAACLWQISNAVDQYTRYDTVNSVSITKHESLSYPAITVCSGNGVRKAYVESLGEPAAQLLQALLFETTTYVRTGVDLRDSNDTEASEIALAIVADAVNSTFYEFVRDAAAQADRTFLYCENGTKLDCLTHVTPVYTVLGMCYTFNARGRLRHLRGDPDTGISLVLNVDVDEYFAPYVTDGVGLHIHIHEPEDLSYVDSGNVLLAPGNNVYMSLQKQLVHNLKKPYSEIDCNDDPDYSYAFCRSECMQRTFFDCGNCSLNGDSDAACPFIESFQCYVRNYDQWYGTGTGYQCDCPQQCRYIQYQHKMSMSAFPNEFSAQFFKSQPNWPFNSTESIRRNTLQLHIYYERFTTEEIYEQPLVNQWQLFSTVGGLMGLFIGCSTMTLFEFPDFLIVFFNKKLARQRHVKVEDIAASTELSEITVDSADTSVLQDVK